MFPDLSYGPVWEGEGGGAEEGWSPEKQHGRGTGDGRRKGGKWETALIGEKSVHERPYEK